MKQALEESKKEHLKDIEERLKLSESQIKALTSIELPQILKPEDISVVQKADGICDNTIALITESICDGFGKE